MSAPVPLELIGIWVGLGWGWAGFGDRLDNTFNIQNQLVKLIIYFCDLLWLDWKIKYKCIVAMLPSISPWLRLDSGVGVRDHPTVPGTGHLWSQWPADPWWCNTIALGEEDYRNKLDTIYPFVSSSLTCSPPPHNDHRRLCKDLIWTVPGQVCIWVLAHILTSLSFVLKWLIMIQSWAPHDRGVAKKIRFCMGVTETK